MDKIWGFAIQYMIAGLAALALLVALVYGIKSYAEGERKAGYDQAVAEYTIKVNDAVAKYRVLEKQGAEAQAVIVAKLNKDKVNALAKKDNTIAALRSGTLILRDPNSTACSGTGAAVTGNTSGSVGVTGGQLSDELAQFLVTEASRADKIVLQLRAAQQLLIEDRKICNGEH